MPVLLTRREPDHVAGADLLDRGTRALHASAAEGDDQRLSKRVRVPRRARARLEGDGGAGGAGWRGRGEEWVDPDGAGEPVGWSLRGGLRDRSLDVHYRSPRLSSERP